MTRALVLVACVALFGGCMSVDATVDAVVAAPDLWFDGGDGWAGQLMSLSQTTPIKIDSPLLHELDTAEVKSVTLRPTAGVHTLDFLRGIALTAHSDERAAVPLVSLGANELVPADDGSLTLPVQVVIAPDYFEKLSVEATIEFIVPGERSSVSQEFALRLTGSTTIGP